MNGTTLYYAVNLPMEPTSWTSLVRADFNGDGNAALFAKRLLADAVWIMMAPRCLMV